jgi:hypothetical protein
MFSILKFNETVISIADETIPKTSTNPKHPGKPRFNDECKDAIRGQSTLSNLYRVDLSPTVECKLSRIMGK